MGGKYCGLAPVQSNITPSCTDSPQRVKKSFIKLCLRSSEKVCLSILCFPFLCLLLLWYFPQNWFSVSCTFLKVIPEKRSSFANVFIHLSSHTRSHSVIIVDWKKKIVIKIFSENSWQYLDHFSNYLPLIVKPVALTSRDAVAQHLVTLSFLLWLPGETQYNERNSI